MSGRSVEHATFVVEREYEASPERAFAAWADPKPRSGSGRFSLAVQPGARSSRSASSTIKPSGPRT
jgi:hypothetical protein